MSLKSLPIIGKENFHLDVAGTYGVDQQYLGFALFLNEGQNRPISVLNLFDSEGLHIESSIWNAEGMQEAEQSLTEAISGLENSKPGDIILKPFNVEQNGLNMKLIPRGDGGYHSSMSYDLLFFPSWDGCHEA